MTKGELLAKKFHETYERLAPNYGYKTREASAKPWEDVPDNNKQLMIAVCQELLDSGEVKLYPSRSKTHDSKGNSVGSYCNNCCGYDYTLKNYESKRVCNYCKSKYPGKFKESD